MWDVPNLNKKDENSEIYKPQVSEAIHLVKLKAKCLF
jgi:hypothetical protein